MSSYALLDGSSSAMLPERGYTEDCITTQAQAVSIIKFEVDRYRQQGQGPPVEVITDILIRYIRGKRSRNHPEGYLAKKLSDLVYSIKRRNLYWEDPSTLDVALQNTLVAEHLNIGLRPPTSGMYGREMDAPPPYEAGGGGGGF